MLRTIATDTLANYL